MRARYTDGETAVITGIGYRQSNGLVNRQTITRQFNICDTAGDGLHIQTKQRKKWTKVAGKVGGETQ